MNITLKEFAGDEAYDRYAAVLPQIDRMRLDISDNRKGNILLTDIPQDATRLKKRMEREGIPDAAKALERVNGTANFQDVCIVKKIVKLGDSVCRVDVPMPFGNTAYGTGFLIGPNILMTNHHVLESADMAKAATARFRYELDEHSRPSKDQSFRLRPDLFFLTSDIKKNPQDPFSGLDFSLVAVEDTSTAGMALSTFPSLALDGSMGKILEGEGCIVIQHPEGDYKKIVLKDIRLLTFTDDFLVYESDTQPGSSGSMVIALGTGEVVGLHHSGVPRKNAAGDWLRKDGSVAQDSDPDDTIDWLGNEGIRISSILKAINGMQVPAAMQPAKDNLLRTHTVPEALLPSAASINNMTQTIQPAATDLQAPTAAQPLQYFEIVLSPQEALQDHWAAQMDQLIPGLKYSERLFPYSTDKQLRRMMYIGIESSKDPWKQAAELEALPQITTCVPDLPTRTYMEEPAAKRMAAEIDIIGGSGGVSDEENWAAFTATWQDTPWYQAAIGSGHVNGFRGWNRVAVNADDSQVTPEIEANLQRLKLMQLDTGYTLHSKNRLGYDLERDYDSVDDDLDAKDLESARTGRFPDHGTRTASLVIGGSLLTDPQHCDGNNGILTKGGKPLIRLRPYRVSNSVILIGRGRDMVAGARHAIANSADVMFMCMGSYPRPMFAGIAKEAYDKGIIWICAAGNQVKVVIAPAIYPGTVAVAAINPAFRPWKGSCRGPEVDISAPGEDVYVPFFHTDHTETMRFGDGTSYATPHVAAAAMLWKAKHLAILRQKYDEPWQTVEAFRWCLQKSVTPFPAPQDGLWQDNFGAGLLNIGQLLEVPLPDAGLLKNAYDGVDMSPSWDLGVIEAVAKIWEALWLNITDADQEAAVGQPLTERGRQGLAALTGVPAGGVLESAGALALPASAKEEVLNAYFKSFSNPVRY